MNRRALNVAIVVALLACIPASAAARTRIAFVPMYATPVARQLPVMLGEIAGAEVVSPPRSWLGDYIAPGDVAAIAAWMMGPPVASADAFVLSTDMLAYGGLDPSRVPGGVDTPLAISRLRLLERLRDARPGRWIAAFGTVMRLEPTAVTPVGPAARYDPIAQPPTWEYIWEYASLHDPPLPAEAERARRLREQIGETTLRPYLATRKRDLEVDLAILGFAASGTLDRLVLGQDDAGPVGLHVRDVRALQDAVARLGIADRAAIEPGADELGSALVAHALARSIGWTPRIAIRYSMPGGATTQDPLEFAPISVTIEALVRLCGGLHDDANPDIVLYVRVPNTDDAHDETLLHDLARHVAARTPVALVDLTFLTRSYAPQAAFVEALLARGIAGKLDAYSSWNTTANSAGIALSEAIAAGVGRRARTYDAGAHAAFMFDRYVEDYLYHDIVRPRVNADLAAHGVVEHYYLSPDAAGEADREVRALIEPLATSLFRRLYPRLRIASLSISLPWPRTAELETDVRVIAR